MFRSMKALFALTVLAATLSPALAAAEDQPRDVNCTVNVSHKVNNGTPQVYNKDFSLPAGTTFFDDFGTSFRFKEFSASSRLDADGKTVVDVNYYNDVTVFESVDFNGSLTMYDDNGTQGNGNQSFFSSRINASHRTDWVIFCARDGK